MVKHCSHGTCKSDSRYPEKLRGYKFIPFPKPKSDLHRCMRWIAMCRRPHSQLNVGKITKHTYICTKHFVSVDGPTDTYPDPCDAISGKFHKARPRKEDHWKCTVEQSGNENCKPTSPADRSCNVDSVCQTEETVFSSLEMFACMARCRQLETENSRLRQTITDQASCKTVVRNSKSAETQTFEVPFSAGSVASSKIKNLFEHYTGLTYHRFLLLLALLFPNSDENPIKYKERRKEVDTFPLEQQLFLYLCRVRSGMHVKDLAYRFHLKVQSVSTVVQAIAKYMYFKLGALSYWPHRSVIIEHMPDVYKADFPSCLAIMDCTEIKIERPSSLKCQSQCFSDYKSATTLKSLVVCDPRGSILFVSDLFSGSISDNDICKQSGFFDYLQSLKDRGYIKTGDALMADKGFRIQKELSDLGLQLNIPPFASSGKVLSAGEVVLTQKIAAHRIHVERAINQIKGFKLLNRKIPVTLFPYINEMWFNATMLTNFQDTLVKV